MDLLKDLEKALLTEIGAIVPNSKKSLTPDEDLLEQGIIDSLGIMKLIVFMEGTCGIAVSDEEIVPENFQTLNQMVRFVEGKMQDR